MNYRLQDMHGIREGILMNYKNEAYLQISLEIQMGQNNPNKKYTT